MILIKFVDIFEKKSKFVEILKRKVHNYEKIASKS